MRKINVENFIGQRFGILEITGKAPNTRFGQMVIVKCDCGNEKQYPLTSLRINKYGSCGCLMKKRQSVGNIIHGLYKHPLYGIWNSIKQRCYTTSDPSYFLYGGRGVRMCEEWLNNPKSFIEWALSNGWRKCLDIDKDINGTGLLYSPETCLIVTRLENQNARRCTRRIELDGVTYTFGEIAKTFSINYRCFYNRIKIGWNIKNAIETPVRYTSRGKSSLI